MRCEEMDGATRNYCPASTSEVNYNPDAVLAWAQHLRPQRSTVIRTEDVDNIGSQPEEMESRQSDGRLTTAALLGPQGLDSIAKGGKQESLVEKWKTNWSGQECKRRAQSQPAKMAPCQAPASPEGDTDPVEPEAEEPEVKYATGTEMLPMAVESF